MEDPSNLHYLDFGSGFHLIPVVRPRSGEARVDSLPDDGSLDVSDWYPSSGRHKHQPMRTPPIHGTAVARAEMISIPNTVVSEFRGTVQAVLANSTG